MNTLKILLLLTFMLSSCSVRKLEKSNVSEATKEEVVVNDNNDIKKTTDISEVTVDSSETITIEPIDTIKPIVINGITYKNARLSYVKNKIVKNVLSKEILVDKGSKKVVKKALVTKKADNKKVKTYPSPLLLLILPLIAIVIVLIRKLML